MRQRDQQDSSPQPNPRLSGEIPGHRFFLLALKLRCLRPNFGCRLSSLGPRSSRALASESACQSEPKTPVYVIEAGQSSVYGDVAPRYVKSQPVEVSKDILQRTSSYKKHAATTKKRTTKTQKQRPSGNGGRVADSGQTHRLGCMAKTGTRP
jgi:hypothetical protein